MCFYLQYFTRLSDNSCAKAQSPFSQSTCKVNNFCRNYPNLNNKLFETTLFRVIQLLIIQHISPFFQKKEGQVGRSLPHSALLIVTISKFFYYGSLYLPLSITSASRLAL